ncbi:Uncharacterised protein [Legionella beliardensis]|uniref:Adenylyl cyclase n=1 Tax=Legionella beliardensis TaxID=91822 RepID=A0A378I069_9GAMM|nr:hypothetical protein [Legionella beliardensis]STX27966.1 Uncharacterised protein [Legionella beliardensis]
MKKIYIATLILSSSYIFAQPIPNPFGPNVIIFDTNMSPRDINTTISTLYNQQRFNEFGEERYALMFMPGQYGMDENIDVKVGYYMHILGLGERPEDTFITGAVRTQDMPPGNPSQPDQGPGALVNFWRGAENFMVKPTLGSLGYPNAIPKDQNVWAVSQATFLRRVKVTQGSLRLFELGYSSGGFLANSQVDGTIYSGSQQQWFTRNSNFGQWNGGVWSMVFVGDSGFIPSGDWPNPSYTIVDKTPIMREKPYLYFNQDNQEFYLKVPALKHNTTGTDWEVTGESLPVSSCYIAKSNNSTSDLNTALQTNRCIIFTPGVYHLDDSLRVTQANTIIYGLGLPTLVSDTGQPAMVVSDVDGVQLAGLIFDAGPIFSPTLLQIGEHKTTRCHASNPTFLYDTFCRVGGPAYRSQASNCLEINSNDVVGDNFWLWRADHGKNVGWYINNGDNGLTVNGDNVIVYNLMVEHFKKYQTIWNGNNGRVYQYQSEIPYDPPSQGEWQNGSVNGYASYKIGNDVTTNQVWGMGIYSYFRDATNLYLDSAIEAPLKPTIDLQHIVLFWLDGRDNTGIRHVVNNTGEGVYPWSRRSNLRKWPE